MISRLLLACSKRRQRWGASCGGGLGGLRVNCPASGSPRRPVRSSNIVARRLWAAARRGALVCLGIRPDRPATGFGYLRCAGRPSPTEAVGVERFVEKPDRATAERFAKVATASDEQAVALREASAALSEVDDITHRNAAAAEELAAMAEEMTAQAETLRTAAGFFHSGAVRR